MSDLGFPEPPEGDVTRGPSLLALLNVTTIIALFFIATRLYTRIVVVRTVGWDDYTLVAAGACAVVTMAFEIEAVMAGEGRHMFYLGDGAVNASKWSQLSIIPNLFSATLARTSMCLFLLRIVKDMLYCRVFLWGIIAVNNIVNLVCCICTFVQCRPLPRLWDPSVPGECWPFNVIIAISSVQGYSSIVCDWTVALFPAVILYRLHMAKRTKWAIGLIMGLGVFIGVAALMKSLSLHELNNRKDLTYESFSLTCWSIIEQNVGIVAVSVPAIRPLFSRALKTGAFHNLAAPAQNRSRGLAMELGRVSGKPKESASRRAMAAVSVSRTGDLEDTISDSSLAKEQTRDRIVRRISVELLVRRNSQADPELGLERPADDPEMGLERPVDPEVGPERPTEIEKKGSWLNI